MLIRVPTIVAPTSAERRAITRAQRNGVRIPEIAPGDRRGMSQFFRALLGQSGGGGGGGGGGTPATILGSDLLVWYKKATGIYDALSGGSLVSSDGTEIGRWEDQSGNGYHAVRSVSIATGQLRWSTTTTDRGAGTVNVRGFADTFLAIPDAVGTALSSAGQGQIWVRTKKAAGACDTSGFCDFGTDSASNHYFWSDCHWYDGFGSNARKDCGSVSFDTASAFQVASMWSAPNDYGAMIDNGTNFSFTTSSNTVSFRTGTVKIGCSNGVYAFNGYVSEIVIAKIKASSTQNTDMQTYLST